jgi:hypothetical protein
MVVFSYSLYSLCFLRGITILDSQKDWDGRFSETQRLFVRDSELLYKFNYISKHLKKTPAETMRFISELVCDNFCRAITIQKEIDEHQKQIDQKRLLLSIHSYPFEVREFFLERITLLSSINPQTQIEINHLFRLCLIDIFTEYETIKNRFMQYAQNHDSLSYMEKILFGSSGLSKEKFEQLKNGEKNGTI